MIKLLLKQEFENFEPYKTFNKPKNARNLTHTSSDFHLNSPP